MNRRMSFGVFSGSISPRVTSGGGWKASYFARVKMRNVTAEPIPLRYGNVGELLVNKAKDPIRFGGRSP